jgi:FolB domain-containing protein
MTQITSVLRLNHIELNLHLGWSEQERAQKQLVFMDIILKFLDPPKACKTDELKDTHCYYSLIKNIQKSTESREFNLIEHATAFIYQSLKTTLSETTYIHVIIHKNLSAVGLSGEAVFEYGDLK